jgi:SAM-dependent methyltransferase
MSATPAPWYEAWFNEDYLSLYGHRDEADAKRQIDLILKLIKPRKGCRILDLACGDGRHSSFLNDKGFNLTGQDLSDSLLTKAKERNLNLKLIKRDMRVIAETYDLILSLFTSFGYFDHEGNLSVLKSISEALSEQGHFWLDYLNPDGIKPSSGEKLLDDGRRVSEHKRIEGKRVIKTINLLGGKEIKTYTESVYLYSAHEIGQFLEELGYLSIEIFGDYDGGPWGPKSPRMIFWAAKGGVGG